MRAFVSLLIFLTCLSGVSPAATLYVRPNGDDQKNGVSPATAFKTLNRAAAALQGGDRLAIAPGIYRESARFMEGFTADNSATAVIGDEDGKLTSSTPGAVVIECTSASDAGISFHRFRNLSISGLTFRGVGQGLTITRSYDVTVQRCTFDGLARGLAVSSSRDVRVQSSVFTRCTFGLAFNQTVDTRIAHVTVAGSSSVGLLALTCGAGVVRNALFADNNTNMVGDTLTASAWSSDYNVLAGTTGPWGEVAAIVCPYEWFAVSGQERHSIFLAPAFRDAQAGDVHIAPTVAWGGGLPGQRIGLLLTPAIAQDRDGKPFRALAGHVSAGAFDYPDPVPGNGWTKLAVKCAADGIRQSAGIYRTDGSLVRLLVSDAAGITDLWWDGLTDTGQPAPVGNYTVKSVAHDVRLLDDGTIADNGSQLGMYNPDSPARIVALPDGGFLMGCYYDEAGFVTRRYSASGFPIHASNHLESGLKALATNGTDVYELLAKVNFNANTAEAIRVVRLSDDGERIPMRNGADACLVQQDAVKGADVGGLAVIGQRAYVSLVGLGVVRVFDLDTGVRVAEYALPGVADIAADPNGTIWVIAGTDLISLNPDGTVGKRFATGLAHPFYLAVNTEHFAIVDGAAGRMALLDRQGNVVKLIGNGYHQRDWAPVNAETLRPLSGCAFLPDGKLALAMRNRIRIFWPETGAIFRDIISTFVDSCVAHPTDPGYAYTELGAFRVDAKTGAWQWVAEAPLGWPVKDTKGNDAAMRYGIPAGAVVLNGTPYVVFTPQYDPTSGTSSSAFFFDVTDPLKPRLRAEVPKLPPWGWWQNFAIARNGDLYVPQGTTKWRVLRYLGPGADGAPQYEKFADGKVVGLDKDPDPTRLMEHKQAPALDTVTGDVFQLAVTKYNNKMIAGWGANTTGLGKYRADGTPLWFVPSSGSTYVTLDSAFDGKATWVLACKAFGGQVELFDTDGLRLATSNWSWPAGYGAGFVDIRYGIRAFIAPGGVVKAYLEDDGVGRISRIRMEGKETVRKLAAPLVWKTAAAQAGAIPDPQRVPSGSIRRALVIPKVAPLPVNGEWSAWAQAGVVPQMLVLPIPSFQRAKTEDALQTLREGTALGAFAHDGSNLYVYFVVANASAELADTGNMLYAFDSLEFWTEEEQFGIGLVKGNQPALFKYRFFSPDRKPYTPGHLMPRENVWGEMLDDLSTNPLGRLLAANTGVSMGGKKGYAVMAKIPFTEIKLTGGIAGRGGQDVLDLTGKPGEVLRMGINVSGILAPGREQDFKMGWPCGLLFADPTSLYPFILGGEKE